MSSSDTNERKLLQKLPPERKGRRGVILLQPGGCCCCCCCCCLHTVGGVVGAAWMGAKYGYPDDSEADGKPPLKSSGLSSTLIYWLSVLAVYLIGLLIASLLETDERFDSWTGSTLIDYHLLWVGLGSLFLFLASAIMSLVLAIVPSMRGDRGYWRAMFRIALGNAAGTAVGVALVVLVFTICIGVASSF